MNLIVTVSIQKQFNEFGLFLLKKFVLFCIIQGFNDNINWLTLEDGEKLSKEQYIHFWWFINEL